MAYGRIDAAKAEAAAREAERASVQLLEAVPLESEGDDGDMVGVLSRQLAEAADREEKVLEGVARLLGVINR